MDVKAIILVGGRSEHAADAGAERIGNIPIAFLDVLGEPVLGRVMRHLERVGVTGVSVVTEVAPSAAPLARGALRPDLNWIQATDAQFWRAAEGAFVDAAQAGAELIIVLRVGPYAEVDFEEMIQFHLDQGGRVTTAMHADKSSLECFVITAARRNDAAFLFRHELKRFRVPCEIYRAPGYVNHLESATDLRRLALDAFAGNNAIRPIGTEVKPGVWTGEGARVHKHARLLAPAYIGARSRVRAMAVITRGSVLEHHSDVDCGTVLESSTLLPYTSVGAALDVVHSVVGFGCIYNLQRNVTVEITDPKLVGVASSSAPARTVSSALELAIFLPKAFISGFFKRPVPTRPASLPEAIVTPSTALKSAPLPASGAGGTDGGFAADLAVARRYGNE